MKSLAYPILCLSLILTSYHGFAQLPIVIGNGKLILNDDSFLRPDPQKYVSFSDSLNLKIKANPSDTTSLFSRAFLYATFNSIIFQPAPGQPVVMQNLLKAKGLVEKAAELKMQDLRLKVLRAQLYNELCYQYGDDLSWKYNVKQISERRSRFNSYKALANKYYDELASLDEKNAYEYQKLKVINDYSIK